MLSLVLWILGSLAGTPRLVPDSTVILQPQRCVSRSGEFEFRAIPSERDGSGAGRHSLLRAGAEVWTKELPFTLWSAVVSDCGVVGGYAYSEGVRSAGELHVVLIGPAGDLVLDQVHPRKSKRSEHVAAFEPSVRTLLLHEDADLFLVAFTELDRDKGGEIWRSYRLSTGEPLKELHARELFTDHGELTWSMCLLPIRETPLTLVQWYEMTEGRRGSWLALLDPELRPVWSSDWPHDFDRLDMQARMALWNKGTLVPLAEPRQFGVRLIGEASRVVFEVEQDPAAPSQWSVSERSREALSEEQPEPSNETLHPRLIAAIDLPLDSSTEVSERSDAVGVDRQGRVLIKEEGTGRVFTFDAAGKRLSVSPPPPDAIAPKGFGWGLQGADGGSVFLRIKDEARHLEIDAHAQVQGVIELGGDEVRFLPGSRQRWVFDDQGFEARRLSVSGERIATISRRPDGHWFRAIRDVSVAFDGSLAILDGPRISRYVEDSRESVVALYSPDGEPSKTISLPQSVHGGTLRYNRGWAVVGKSLVRMSDGHAVTLDVSETIDSNHAWTTFLAPDGREIWCLQFAPPRLIRYALPG